MCYNVPARLFFASKVAQIIVCAYCVDLHSKVLICSLFKFTNLWNSGSWTSCKATHNTCFQSCGFTFIGPTPRLCLSCLLAALNLASTANSAAGKVGITSPVSLALVTATFFLLLFFCAALIDPQEEGMVQGWNSYWLFRIFKIRRGLDKVVLCNLCL